MKNKYIITIFTILITLYGMNTTCMDTSTRDFGDLSILPEELIQHITTSVVSIISESASLKEAIPNIFRYLNKIKSLNKNFYNLINSPWYEELLKIIGNKIKTKFNADEPFLLKPKHESQEPVYYSTFLIQAAKKGDLNLVKLLLHAGAGLEPFNLKIAISQATKKGHTDIVELLSEKFKPI